jgi:hypothetical protein
MFSATFIVWLFIIIDVVSGHVHRDVQSAESDAQGQRPKGTPLSFDLRAEYCGLSGFRRPSYEQIEQLDCRSTPTFTLRARPTTVYRPRSQADLQQARVRSLHNGESQKVEWETVEILGPDIEDRQTLIQLARMTGNAYALPGKKNWYDIDPKWNNVRRGGRQSFLFLGRCRVTY